MAKEVLDTLTLFFQTGDTEGLPPVPNWGRKYDDEYSRRIEGLSYKEKAARILPAKAYLDNIMAAVADHFPPYKEAAEQAWVGNPHTNEHQGALEGTPRHMTGVTYVVTWGDKIGLRPGEEQSMVDYATRKMRPEEREKMPSTIVAYDSNTIWVTLDARFVIFDGRPGVQGLVRTSDFIKDWMIGMRPLGLVLKNPRYQTIKWEKGGGQYHVEFSDRKRPTKAIKK